MWGAYHSLLREELQALSFFLVEDCHAEGGGRVYGEIVSQPLQLTSKNRVFFLFAQCIVFTQTAFRVV